jgi:hypothetical protein
MVTVRYIESAAGLLFNLPQHIQEVEIRLKILVTDSKEAKHPGISLFNKITVISLKMTWLLLPNFSELHNDLFPVVRNGPQ